MVRAAAYRIASLTERQEVHRALAEATDPETDPDRRAWHLAQATLSADETVAADLERSAGRARARGGFVAASALLERAARLTPDPARRAQRALAAAWAKREAGQLDAALALLAPAEAGPPDALLAGEIEHLRGLVAFDRRRSTDSARLLLDAARQLEAVDGDVARETYLDALTAAIWARGADAPDVVLLAATAARAAPPAKQPERALDVVLDALAIRLTEGYVAAGPLLARALTAVRMSRSVRTRRASALVWRQPRQRHHRHGGLGFGAARALAERQVELARNSGALVQLQFALNLLATNEILSGNLAAAGGLIEEARVAAEASANPPITYSAMLLSAYRGQEQLASRLIDGARGEAVSAGEGRIATFADYAGSVLYNGLGRHDLALAAARRVFERDVVGGYQVMAVAELAEAASRMHDPALLSLARSRSNERATVTGTDWALGIQARIEASPTTVRRRRASTPSRSSVWAGPA